HTHTYTHYRTSGVPDLVNTHTPNLTFALSLFPSPCFLMVKLQSLNSHLYPNDIHTHTHTHPHTHRPTHTHTYIYVYNIYDTVLDPIFSLQFTRQQDRKSVA